MTLRLGVIHAMEGLYHASIAGSVFATDDVRERLERICEEAREVITESYRIGLRPWESLATGLFKSGVRVLASSVQYTDVLIRRHLYPQTAAHRPPFVLEYDVVGGIDQLGDGVSGFRLGDRVADLTVVGSTLSRSICLGKNFELEPPAFVFPGVDFFRPAGE